MRAVVIIVAAAIVVRAAVTPVAYLVVDTGDGTAAVQPGILAGSLARCEEELALSALPARCETVSGGRHLLGIAAAAWEKAVGASWRPVQHAGETAAEAVQDAALDAVQDMASDAVQDMVGGDDPLD